MPSPEDIITFRAAHPEFGDTTLWPDWQVRTALDIAVRLNGDELMQNLATSHLLSMFKQHSYPMTQRSDGSVRVHFQVPDMSVDEAFWNSSSYGRMYMSIWKITGTSIATGFYGSKDNRWWKNYSAY